MNTADEDQIDVAAEDPAAEDPSDVENRECTLFTEGVCKGEQWNCETCNEPFCQVHWHNTAKGENVECRGCEDLRLGRGR